MIIEIVTSINFFVRFLCSINRLSTENVRMLLELIKQNGTHIPLTAEDIADKYNAKIIFRPGEWIINSTYLN